MPSRKAFHTTPKETSDEGWDEPRHPESGVLTPGARGLAFRTDVTPAAIGLPPGATKLIWLLPQRDAGPSDLFATGGAELLSCSPSGRLVAIGTRHGNVVLCELGTGRRVALFGSNRRDGTKRVTSLAFSPCGRYLAVCLYHGTGVQLWDLDRVQKRSPGPAATGAQREDRWRELVSDDAAAAHLALAALAGSKNAAALAASHLTVPRLRRESARSLVPRLDDEAFAAREAAEAGLARLGCAAEPGLRPALAGRPSAELRSRVNRLLLPLVGPAAWARRGRALDLLERRAAPGRCDSSPRSPRTTRAAGSPSKPAKALERLKGRGLYKPKEKK